WCGVERIRPALPKPRPTSLPHTFAAVVAGLIADVDVVGVKVSGGLDSLAVLVHVVRAASGRRVIAFTTDLTCDAGLSAAAVVRRLLVDLNLNVELVVLDPYRERTEPVWSPVGPRLDALPEVNAATAAIAARLGVEVLLSGDGANELLGVPRFATAHIAARFGPRAAVRYGRDVAQSGPGLVGEAAAVVAGWLPPVARARSYWAANWPAWCDPVAPAVLAEPHRTQATVWARRWVDEHITAHAAASRSWAASDAHDALFPREVTPPAGSVPEISPFLHEDTLAAALALPLADRYHPRLPSAYSRCKAQVVRLLPRTALPVLPQRKQYFSSVLAQQAAAGATAALAVETGLLDPGALAAETGVAELLTIAAIERWLRGAEKAGAAIA
ncbi:MAG TPA: asparagine synthase-related protein, partial [Pseudonocardiaceae bacterium]|nr:asparagine synthase-related protein [Pseudonocardiaceae bacterium]